MDTHLHIQCVELPHMAIYDMICEWKTRLLFSGKFCSTWQCTIAHTQKSNCLQLSGMESQSCTVVQQCSKMSIVKQSGDSAFLQPSAIVDAMNFENHLRQYKKAALKSQFQIEYSDRHHTQFTLTLICVYICIAHITCMLNRIAANAFFPITFPIRNVGNNKWRSAVYICRKMKKKQR